MPSTTQIQLNACSIILNVKWRGFLNYLHCSPQNTHTKSANKYHSQVLIMCQLGRQERTCADIFKSQSGGEERTVGHWNVFYSYT